MSDQLIITFGFSGFAVIADDIKGSARVVKSTYAGRVEHGQPYCYATSGRRKAILAAVDLALSMRETEANILDALDVVERGAL